MRSNDKIVKGKVKDAQGRTNPTKPAGGDNYGVGYKNPVGKFDSYLTPKVKSANLKVKPKKLA